MSNLEQAIVHLDRLSDLEISYMNTLLLSRIQTHPLDKSFFLDLPRELRDRVYYFAAVNFWESMRRPQARRDLDHVRLHKCCSKAVGLARGLDLRMANKQIGSEFGDVVYGPDMIKGCFTESPTMLDGVPQQKPAQTMSSAMVKSVLESGWMFRWRYGEFGFRGWEGGPGEFILKGRKGESVTPGVREECHFAQAFKDVYGEVAFVGYLELVVLESGQYTYKIGPALGSRDQIWKYGDLGMRCTLVRQEGMNELHGLGLGRRSTF